VQDSVLQICLGEILKVMRSKGADLTWDRMLMHLSQPKVKACELFHLVILQGWYAQVTLECARKTRAAECRLHRLVELCLDFL
jgi:hypothetical protein